MIPANDGSRTYFHEHLAACMAELEAGIMQLDPTDREFASNIILYYSRKRILSDKQEYWMHKFWSEYVWEGNDSGIEKLPLAPAAEAPRVTVNPSPIAELLLKAKQQLQFPVIRYTVKPPIGNAHSLNFYITGEKSQHPGQIGVSQNKFPDSRTLAILLPANKTVWLPAAFPVPTLQQLIKKIAENPLEMLAENGKETAHCCFCQLPLTNKSSIFHGYGPICADNYGLPWGDVPEDDIKLDVGLE